MPRRPTPASRWASVAAVVLALVLLERTLHAGSTSVLVLEAVVALLAVLGGVATWLRNCFEAHLVLVLAVAAAVIGTVLSLILGMPGGGPTEPSATHVLTLLLSCAIAVLLVLDARIRGSEH